MSKQEESNTTTTLNEKLMDEFSNSLEATINKVCENNPELDPRLELLVTLSTFSAQVGIDSGYNKEEFLSLMEEMFDDFQNNETTNDTAIAKKQNKIDISKLN